MSTLDKIKELNTRREMIEKGGNEEVVVARQRIEQLLDAGSFVEVGQFVQHRSTSFNMTNKQAPADGVVTGYGTISGRLVYVYSQDITVLSGAVGEMHAKKIGNVYDLAMKMGAPIIGLLDSAGLRLQEATDGLGGYGEIFLKQSIASGVIPQVAVILGNCAGGAAMIPSIADFTFMMDKKANLFINSPHTMEKGTALEDIGSAAIHSEVTGLVDFIEESEDVCFSKVRELIDLLPANNMDEAPVYELSDDLNRECENLQEEADMRSIIAGIADQGQFFETKSLYGTAILTGFIRLNGATVGVVANNEPELDVDACEKAASFVNLCDAFNISILTLTDVKGYKASKAEEQRGLAKAIAKLTYAFANTTSQKVNVIVGEAFGSAYVTMNSKHISADMVFAWPTAKISVMNARSAVGIMYDDEIQKSDASDEVMNAKAQEFEEMQATPYAAASRGYIDDVIDPAFTRKHVIAALEMLISKRDNRPGKKHGTML